MSAKTLSLLLVSIVLIASGSIRAEDSTVEEVTVTAGGPTVFELLQDGQPVTAITLSPTVQGTLIPALLSGSTDVKCELIEGTKTIHRVEPYKPGRPPSLTGAYSLSRLATQRGADGRGEHLEVFLKDENSQEKAVNVYSPLLQQLFFSVHSAQSSMSAPIPLHVTLVKENIVAVKLSSKPAPVPPKSAKPRAR